MRLSPIWEPSESEDEDDTEDSISEMSEYVSNMYKRDVSVYLRCISETYHQIVSTINDDFLFPRLMGVPFKIPVLDHLVVSPVNLRIRYAMSCFQI